MKRFVLTALAALLLYLPTVRSRNLGDCGASSRLATAESLVERGTFRIDESTFAYTCDRMMVDGALYSDKPPLLSLLATLAYGGLHHGLGMRFDPTSRPSTHPIDDPTYGAMVVLVIVVCQALLLALFDRGLGRFGVEGVARLVATASLGFATLLWPLAGLFNSHTPAALAIFAGLYALHVARAERPLLAGLALGAAAAIDVPIGGLALVAGLVSARGRLRFLAGAALPLLVHTVFNVAIVGDPVPFQLHRELYNEVTGHDGSALTGFDEDQGVLFYAGRNLVGALGVFSLTPLLGLALWLGVRARKGDRRRLAWVASALFVATCGLYVFAWPDAVGCSYGMRHLTPVTAPLLLVAAGEAVGSKRLRFMWLVLAALSAVLTAPGVLGPTTCAGFERSAKGLVPAYVFWSNVDELMLR